jgi:tryptophan-rich sensory protein
MRVLFNCFISAFRKKQAQKMSHTTTIGYLLLIIAIVVIFAIISALITSKGVQSPWWRTIKVSPSQPRPEVFSSMWLIIYIILIAATYAAVWKYNQIHDDYHTNMIIGLLVINMGLQLLWCYAYFCNRSLMGGMILIILTLIAAIALAYYVGMAVPFAGLAILVYVIWLCFASYFNFQTVVLNPTINNQGYITQ